MSASGLARLRWKASISFGGAVLGLQVAVLDVEVADDQVAAGEEVLADGHELLEPGDVAVGDLLGSVVDLAQAAEADDGRDDQGEDEESERGAEPRGQAQVQEGLHGPGYRLVRLALEAAHHLRPLPASEQLRPVGRARDEMAHGAGVEAGGEAGAHEQGLIQ